MRAGVVILVSFWALLVASTWNKSLTGDELVPPVAGYTYWKYGDFRLDPENGNLPQRLAGLPLLALPPPPVTSKAWLTPSQWTLGDEWLHGVLMENVSRVLRLGRASSAFGAVALAAIVWLWARRIFGPAGGMLSLMVCVLNPSVLANGPLMTSETCTALFFLAATWAWWELIHQITISRFIASALAAGGLLVSKMSAPLLIPIALLLITARLANPIPLEIALVRYHRKLPSMRGKLVAIGIAALLQVFATYVLLWGCYNFRYAAIAPSQMSDAGSAPLWQGIMTTAGLAELVESLDLKPDALQQARKITNRNSIPLHGWNLATDQALQELREKVLSAVEYDTLQARRARPPESWVMTTVQFCAHHRLFPEAYLLGVLHVWRFSQLRTAFLDGEHYLTGKRIFFPYTFAVKTPLALFGLMLAAAWAGRRVKASNCSAPWRHDWLYQSAPLWILFISYWAAAIASHLNIGHRHILPIYPPLFVLCGAASLWLTSAPFSSGSSAVARASRTVVIVLVGLLALETAWRFPHYLAYFNGLIAPAKAHRHFVDSTLDWGQDLPGVKTYIDEHPAEGPFYLSYFGNGDPRSYNIQAHWLPSNPGRFQTKLGPVIFVPVDSAAALTPQYLSQLQQDYPVYDLAGMDSSDGRPRAVLLRRPNTWLRTKGTYLISATNLQGIYSAEEETAYQALRPIAEGLLGASTLSSRNELLTRFSLSDWQKILEAFEGLQQARLAAYLRAYNPNASIGYSILVFKVSESDLQRAFEGPAPLARSYLNRTLQDETRTK